MKRIIVTFFVSALLCSVACKAQTSQPQIKKHSSQAMQQMLVDSLHLTNAQADSVVSIRKQTMSEVMTVKADSSLSADQKQAQIKSVKQQMKIRLKTILSKDQMKQLEEMQRNMHKGKMQNENA